MGDADAQSAVRPYISVYDPSGALLAFESAGTATTAAVGYSHQVPVGGAGAYTVIAQDSGAGGAKTGGYNLELAIASGQSAGVDADGEGGPIASGQTKNAAINGLGNLDIYTFSAAVGQTFAVTMGDADAQSAVRPYFSVYDPSGALLAFESAGAATDTSVDYSHQVPVGGAGVYTVIAQDSDYPIAKTGGYNLELAIASGQAAGVDADGDGGPITSGQTKNAAINRLGNLDIYTFSAAVGQTFAVTMGDADALSAVRPYISVYDPSGALLVIESAGTATNTAVGYSHQVPAGGAGVYTVIAQDSGYPIAKTGGYNLELAIASGQAAGVDADGEGGPIANGQTKSAAINRLGNLDIYTFSAAAGQTFAVTMGDADAQTRRSTLLQRI